MGHSSAACLITLKHILLYNPRLRGWEYGMLRAFEEEIVRQTGALKVEVPAFGSDKYMQHLGHGIRWSAARKFLPKKSLPIDADVLWYILMGPENFELDLFKDWNAKARHRIVYLFDTLEPQFQLTHHLFSNDDFTTRYTSFHDAVPALEKITSREWLALAQGVPTALFRPVPVDQRVIDFSAYGRRWEPFHQVLREFCDNNQLYYDYTTHMGKIPNANEGELYRQYAWHLSHSKFTVSWPVELTNPVRAGRLHPVTCRWFEAASAGTPIIGRKPDNPVFDEVLVADLVMDIDPHADKKTMWKRLDQIWEARHSYLERSAKISMQNAERWSWETRVSAIIANIEAKDKSTMQNPIHVQA